MIRSSGVVLAVALASGAAYAAPPSGISAPNQAKTKGTGLVLDSVTGITLPLIGNLGDVVIDQAVLTNFALVENTVGQIVGVQANGVLQLTGGVLGTNVLTENFNTTATVTSSGPGQCDVVNIDLAPITVNALVASVDIPAASVDVKASGAVGVLLCDLANALSGLTSGTGALAGTGSIVNALNSVL